MCEKRVLRRIFGPKRDEVTGELRKLHNEELNDLSFTTDIRIMKSRINEMGGAWSSCGRQVRCMWCFVWETCGKEALEDLDVNGRVILSLIFRKWHGGHGLHQDSDR
jgi:hypothetical protein